MDNMNLFSDAMASGKNSGKYDNPQEYEKRYYSDDNQYIQTMIIIRTDETTNNQVMITTPTMVMTIINKYLITIVMKI